MALLTVNHTHQTSKPPSVTREKDLVVIRWGELGVRMPAEEAQILAASLGSTILATRGD